MTDPDLQTRSLEFERELPHPPGKVWRALTTPHLLGEWLMQADFTAEVGEHFTMRAEWGEVRGEVLAVEPERTLSYSWNGPGLESTVTWTLEPSATGTRLRLEQSDIPAANKQAYHGARAGWPRFLDALEGVLLREERSQAGSGAR